MDTPCLHIATIDELDIIRELGRQTFLESFAKDNTANNISQYVEDAFSEDQMIKELSNAESEFYLASIENRPIGYLKVNFGEAQTEKHDKNAVEIERIYVVGDYQGKQVGKLLFDKAFEIAKARKATYLWLGVWEKNLRAIKFYHKHGFMAFGKHRFLLGNDQQTDILMQLEVTPRSSIK